MPFRDSHSADVRLAGDERPLTEEEIRELLPWVRMLSIGARERLQAELSLMQLAALKRHEHLTTRQLQSFADFDESTATTNRWMIGFTAAVTGMTLAILILTLYPLFHERSVNVTKQAAKSETPAMAEREEVKADPRTWESAEVSVNCPKKEKLLSWFSTDGKGKQVTLNCTMENHTDKTVPLTAPSKTDALFRLPDGRVVRGHAYLGSNQHEIPARGKIQMAGLFPGNEDCPAREADDECLQVELMNSNELLLTDTVSGVRYLIHVQ